MLALLCILKQLGIVSLEAYRAITAARLRTYCQR